MSTNESNEIDAANMEGMICPNISPRERQRRLNFGITALVAGLGAFGALLAFGMNRWLRVLLFVPFYLAANGYFQWHDKTCVGLAQLNSRQVGDKVERIEDAAELAAVKMQAQRVQMKSAVAAVAITLVALVLPALKSKKG